MKTHKFTLILAVACLGVAARQTAWAQTWVRTSAPSNSWTAAAISADGLRLVAVASGAHPGPIYTSTNYGATWISNSAALEVWNGVASSADGAKLVAVCGQVYTNSGTTWAEAFSPGSPGNQQSADTVASSADGTKLVLGDNLLFTPLIYTSTDAGASWLSSTSSPNAGWVSVASSADGNRLIAARAAGAAGAIYTTANAGGLWVSNSVLPLPWSWVASSGNGSNLLAVAAPVLYASTNAGASWYWVQTLANSVTKIACATNGNIWYAVSTNSGLIYSSFNAGATWSTNTAAKTNWSAIAVSGNGLRAVATSGSGGIYVLAPPPLKLNLATNKVSLLWDTNYAAFGLALEQNTNLTGANWTTVTNLPTITNTSYQVTLPSTNRQLFFRLKAP